MSKIHRLSLQILLIAVVIAGSAQAQETWTIPAPREDSSAWGSAGPSPHSADPFAAGRWVSPFYVSGAIGNEGQLIQVHVGLGYYILNRLSLNFEAVGGYADADDQPTAVGGDSATVGFDLLARWHVLVGPNWSVYLDGGAGLRQFGPRSYPAAGTHFNFTPQAGAGATLRLNHDLWLMGGARWLHISNADIDGEDQNPGDDAVQVYLGALVLW